MTRKECEEIKRILTKYVYDENKNQRPEVVRALALIEIELLHRIRQSRSQKETFFEDNSTY